MHMSGRAVVGRLDTDALPDVPIGLAWRPVSGAMPGEAGHDVPVFRGRAVISGAGCRHGARTLRGQV